MSQVVTTSPTLKRLCSTASIPTPYSPSLNSSPKFDSSPSIKRTRKELTTDLSYFPSNNPKPKSLHSFVSRSCKPVVAPNGKRFYSEDDVQQILDNALSSFEEKLKSKYDQILAEKLQDQYNCFVTFNNEYLSKNVGNGDLSYYC
ncbi:hypothetical protein GEMRC1_006459 [Eukaryota sp. GEM-RC1]